MSNSSLRKGSSIVYGNSLGSNGTVSTAFLNLTSIEASLQQISNGQSKTFIASNNKANDFSPTTVITEPVLPVLSTFSVAQTSTTQIENIVLSTNVPPENFASKHSSLNIQNDSSSAKPHSSAISSRVSELTPETTPTTSKFTGIILPSSPADKKNLSTSQARDNSYGYSYQGALTKSALLEIHEKRLNSQTRGQFSSSSSILGQISSYYDTTASANDGSRLFIEGSVSLKGLPQTFLHGSRTIWKTTQFYPREEQTTFMFSSQIHATQTSDTKMGTAAEARKFSSISGMPQATLAAKTSPNKNDDFALTYATTTHPSRVTQMVASSVVHSQIQREISVPISTVLTASPSNRKISSQPGATTTILSTSAIPEPVITIKNSEFSSRPKKESPILRSSNREYSSSRMSFTIRRSSKDSESSFQETTKNIFLNQTTNFVPRETVSPSKVPSSVKKTSSLAATGLQTHSVPSRTVELKISFITRASASVKLSSQQTENLASLSSGEFSVRNSDSYRQTRISTSSSGISAIRFSSTQSSDMTRNVVLSSGSYSTSPSQILIQRSAATYSHSVPLMSRGTISENGHQFYLSSQRSAVSTEPLSSSTKHTSATSSLLMISHSQTPQRRSFATLEGQLFTPSLHSAVTVLLGKSKLQSSSPVLSSSGSSRTELTSEIIVSTFDCELREKEWG